MPPLTQANKGAGETKDRKKITTEKIISQVTLRSVNTCIGNRWKTNATKPAYNRTVNVLKIKQKAKCKPKEGKENT